MPSEKPGSARRIDRRSSGPPEELFAELVEAGLSRDELAKALDRALPEDGSPLTEASLTDVLSKLDELSVRLEHIEAKLS